MMTLAIIAGVFALLALGCIGLIAAIAVGGGESTMVLIPLGVIAAGISVVALLLTIATAVAALMA